MPKKDNTPAPREPLIPALRRQLEALTIEDPADRRLVDSYLQPGATISAAGVNAVKAIIARQGKAFHAPSHKIPQHYESSPTQS